MMSNETQVVVFFIFTIVMVQKIVEKAIFIINDLCHVTLVEIGKTTKRDDYIL